MAFVSCAKLTAELALKQGVLKDCNGADLPAGTEMATCADLAGLSIADATDTTKGKVALNAGTSLPGDATNCTDALTACGLNALLADATVGGNTVINGIKALIPLATTTVAGLIEEATGEETRLGATDANRADRAVTPESMSYALQTGKDYPIHVNTSSINSGRFIGSQGADVAGQARVVFSAVAASNVALRYAIQGVIDGGTAAPTSGDTTAIIGTVFNGTTTPTGAASFGVYGSNISPGAGTKYGAAGVTLCSGGTNIGLLGAADGGTTNWAAYLDGNVAGGAYTTLSDATLKENVEAIDAAKALQFRNGLSWKKYEMFTEKQVEIMDAEGNATGRYEVKRSSQGIKRGLIAQEVQALAASIGDFTDVVVEVGEYFTLDAQGYPVKDAQGNNIVNKRLGLDYDAVQFIICAGEQSLLPAVV